MNRFIYGSGRCRAGSTGWQEPLQLGNTISKVDSNPITYTLDAILLKLNSNGNQGPFWVDNVQVETNVTIPEPVTSGLIGVASVVLLRKRTRCS